MNWKRNVHCCKVGGGEWDRMQLRHWWKRINCSTQQWDRKKLFTARIGQCVFVCVWSLQGPKTIDARNVLNRAYKVPGTCQHYSKNRTVFFLLLLPNLISYSSFNWRSIFLIPSNANVLLFRALIMLDHSFVSRIDRTNAICHTGKKHPPSSNNTCTAQS